ncbi:MAG: TolC family protein [Odoribacter sp.]
MRKQYHVAKLQHAIAQLVVEHTVDNMIYAADVSYWTVAANKDLFQLSQQYVQLVTELYGIVNKRFEEGAISKTDLLMVQNRLKEAELQLNTTAMNYKIALQSLNIMMGNNPDMEIVLTDSIKKCCGHLSRKVWRKLWKREQTIRLRSWKLKLLECRPV